MSNKSLLIIIAFMILSLSACEKKGSESANFEANLISPESVIEETQPHVTVQNEIDGKSLTIDADVEIGDIKEIAEVKILIDEDALLKAVDRFVRDDHPEVTEEKTEDQKRSWDYYENGDMVISCSLSENGIFYYLNYPLSLKRKYMDSGHLIEYGYFTEMTPPGMDLSAEETSEKIREILEEYSCFTFIPWNIQAEDKPEASDKSGCYVISMQAVYEGMKVSVKAEANSGPLSTSVEYSSDGICSIQGKFIFQDGEKRKIERIADLDSVMENLKVDVSSFSSGDRISVNHISIEFFPEMNEDYSYTLVPVWSFDCIDSRTDNEQGVEKEYDIKCTYMYRLEDGSFLGIYY